MIVVERLKALRRYCVGLSHELNRDGMPDVALEVQHLHIQLNKVIAGIEDFGIEDWKEQDCPALKGLCPEPEDMLLVVYPDGSIGGDTRTESLIHALDVIPTRDQLKTLKPGTSL